MIETDYSGSIIWDTHAGGYIVLLSTIDVKLSKALTVATNITNTLGDITATQGDIVVMQGDIDLVHVDHKLKLPIKNDAASPTLQFGDGDSGFYEIADDEVGLALAGVLKWQTEGCCFMGANAAGPCIINETASATNPTLTPDRTDNDTGIGHSGGDALSLVAGGVEGHRITEVGSAITHELTGTVQGPDLNNYMVQKASFDILGLMTDPRFLNLMCEDPGAGTLSDVSGQGHDGTYNGTMITANRLMKNMGWTLDFDGTDDYIQIADHNDLSFGDGANDEAVTWFGVIKVGTGTSPTIISKMDETTGSELREWSVYLQTSPKLTVMFYDESANVYSYRATDVALTAGWHTFVISYDGAGGAAAANTINIYIDGAIVASTATNDGGYVAMENLNCPVIIAGKEIPAGTIGFLYNDDMGCLGIDGSEWSAYDSHRFDQLMKGLYGL